MRASSALVLLALCTASACGGTGAASAPPDVLVVVWDTTRSDRLSAYGYDTATTPWLERFQAEATTFDCLAPGSNTIATHGSLFTGLPPRAHGATFRNKRLPADHETLAERLSAHGYATWLYSANPVLSSPVGFDQGFEVVDHPWDEDRADAAVAAMLPKVRGGDNGTGVRVRLEGGEWGGSDLTGSGELAAPATEAFLAGLARDDDDRPVFALVNLMDAHYPLLPARPFRERVMDAEAIAESYAISRRWNDLWRDTAGVEPIDERARAVASAMYDAAMAELDAHTEALVAVFLDGLGPERAARAIVAVTSDHGEHLGERYGGVPMHDHRYSLYDELLRVPLVVRGCDGSGPLPVDPSLDWGRAGRFGRDRIRASFGIGLVGAAAAALRVSRRLRSTGAGADPARSRLGCHGTRRPPGDGSRGGERGRMAPGGTHRNWIRVSGGRAPEQRWVRRLVGGWYRFRRAGALGPDRPGGRSRALRGGDRAAPTPLRRSVRVDRRAAGDARAPRLRRSRWRALSSRWIRVWTAFTNPLDERMPGLRANPQCPAP
ncbi:MAG: sulfatase-like hydrolase/transferase [Planctomycetota bacterium]